MRIQYQILLSLLISFTAFADRAEYDDIASAYQKSKKLDVRAAVDDFSVSFYLGDLRGKSVLDLACGEGHYARQFANAGAKPVVGVDISSEMIALAQRQEEKSANDIRYIVHDASKPIDGLGSFDVVTGIFLLHYASSKKQLCEFTDQIYRDLKPSGVFIGLNAEPKSINFDPDYYRSYGFAAEYQKPVRDGSRVDVKLFNQDGSIAAFHAYNFARETYADCFRKSGFTKVEFLPILIDPKSISDKGWEYWSKFIEKPSSVIMKAVK